VNSRGFGVVGFLILLPFLVSILASIAGAALMLKADAHLKHECRTSVLTSQRAVAEKLRDLMNLNPLASALRAEDARAKLALKVALASGHPLLIAPAQLNVALVESKRMALKIRQQALIISARAQSFEAPYKAKAAIVAGLSGEALANGVTRPRVTSTSRFGRFDISAAPPGDMTPDYNPSSTFSAEQIVDVDVRIKISSLFPEWLRRLLPSEGLEITSHCQSTIEHREDKWIETLNAVK
jgi:hypothetical protein